ncbi:phospholipid N-methyltransferase [Caldalkalibacillus uzonensis]|uniref:Phospholipid N-methyltransferase n=1 Tax=Caldalkalibacillus uzonensis TaxID=353224 RepID=A0ABU0CS61_9BACI|nr:methyltransferase [Caldalkalibacillus uzonensis]MDQ0338928.1 phospholipid N-methyltransferase [Caldalkalibacillus uzonensis]
MDRKLFLQTFLHSPTQVGSVVPSSSFMVRKITDLVARSTPSTVVEFGAGTGVITRELNHYCEENQATLMIFEKDDKLRDYLSEQFPHLPIYSDALHLPKVLQKQGKKQVDCIVCGLPFTLFPQELRDQFFELIYSSLTDDGALVMYQFSWHMRKALKQKFGSVELNFIPLNIPPAFVYYCKK